MKVKVGHLSVWSPQSAASRQRCLGYHIKIECLHYDGRVVN